MIGDRSRGGTSCAAASWPPPASSAPARGPGRATPTSSPPSSSAAGSAARWPRCGSARPASTPWCSSAAGAGRSGATANTFATFEEPDGRAYWLRDRTGEAILGLPQLEKPIDRYVGVLEVVEGNGIYIGAGAGVGGGSLVFNAIIVKPRRELFERLFPREVDFDEMEDVYYPRVKRILRSAPIPA